MVEILKATYPSCHSTSAVPGYILDYMLN